MVEKINYNRELLLALNSFLWYEGLSERKLLFQTAPDDIIHKFINQLRFKTTEQNYFSIDDAKEIFGRKIFGRYSMLWQILVEMFGSYGTSSRTGWIEKREEAADFLVTVVTANDLDYLGQLK